MPRSMGDPAPAGGTRNTMHFMEAATLLTAISNAYQVLRARNPTSDVTSEAAPVETSPTLVLAYDFVRSSQEWALQRLQAANSRLQTLFAVAAVLTVAAPLLSGVFEAGPELDSPLLIAAVLAFGLLSLTALAGLAPNVPRLISAASVLERHLSKSEWQFMTDMLSQAAENESYNEKLLQLKDRAGGLMTLLLALEVVLLVAWLMV